MKHKQPPFQITNKAINYVAEISELIGRLTSAQHLSVSPTLRRANRIRTIHGSLAIEQNTLTLEQVTAVLNGKQVLAPPKDIAEVKNAYEIYERLEELDPYSVDDLLTAHGIMTRGLVEESGVFRNTPVGVVDQEGHVLHFGTLPQYVPGLIMELLDWVKNSDIHMLIRSCVFHYEFELIHPFADGNGRVGRLWHTLLLSKWNPAFAWLPVESMIHDRQQEYYEAINASNDAGESTVFVEFMLSTIKASLIDAIKTSDEMSDGKIDKVTLRWHKIQEYLKTHDYIMNADVRERIILQSKCGIRKGYFDFSKEHILKSVDGILSRLKTDYLDVLLLHRPDALVEPEEVAEAFNILRDSGKVRHFGVSNQKPMQIKLLQRYLEQPILADQLQFSIPHAGMVTNGINVNMTTESSFDHDGSILDFCRLSDITIQAWSPFQYGFFEGVFLDNDKFPELNATINRLAEKYGVTNTTIAVAWILRHPAKMQTVTGTMNTERLLACIQAADVTLTREEWYEIYRAAGNIVP
mgnify:CR=1 FL=1